MLRPDWQDLQDILCDMATCGSFTTRSPMFLLSSDAVDFLEEKAWILGHGSDFYTLTDRAARCLLPIVSYGNPTRIGAYTACGDPAKMTLMELVQKLSEDGWEEQPVKDPRKENAFVKHGRKVWHPPMDKAPFRSYLHVLVMSQSILKNTTKAIHHGQLDSCRGYVHCNCC